MIVQTADITRETRFSPSEGLQVYCGLDSCVTLEVLEELQRLFPQPPAIYSFARALQAPYLAIMQRGWAVDELARQHAAKGLRERLVGLEAWLQRMAQAVWGRSLNPRSPAQLKEFFYSAMRMPEVQLSVKGVRKVSTSREALEKLDAYLYARPLVATILRIRDLAKQLQVLETEIDPDGRFRASYNIAGTETGRSSSSTNAFGTGGNAQNLPPGLRYVFVADPGWKLCVVDLEQVEARDTGFFCGCLFDDWSFLNNCESGDLHTANAKLVWPELPWTGHKAQDRAIANRLYYRDFSYRDVCKRLGHLIDYMGTPWTASRILRLPLPLVEDFYKKYVSGPSAAYPCIPRFWQWVAQQLQTRGYLDTPFGRRRHFFGRHAEDATLREAIAFLPQSTTADRTNLGMWRIWKKMPQVQLLGNGYDSVAFQFREDADEQAIVAKAIKLMEVELVAPNGRRYTCPGEAQVGWNWGKRHDEGKPIGPGNRANQDGLVKWSAGKRDARQRQVGLKRVML